MTNARKINRQFFTALEQYQMVVLRQRPILENLTHGGPIRVLKPDGTTVAVYG